MVTQQHALNTVLRCLDDILSSLYTLQNNRQTSTSLTYPSQVIPTQRLVNILRHKTPKPTSLLILAALTATNRRLDSLFLRSSLICLALPRYRCVNCYKDSFYAETTYGFEQLDGLFVVGVDV
jgi:hypothetical protein